MQIQMPVTITHKLNQQIRDINDNNNDIQIKMKKFIDIHHNQQTLQQSRLGQYQLDNSEKYTHSFGNQLIVGCRKSQQNVKQKCQNDNDDQLQKKSTRETSLYSQTHIIKQQSQKNLQTHSDIICEQYQLECRVCLDTSHSQSYDYQSNPIFKSCGCNNFIHLRCLEQWITHREIISMNTEVKVNQCEVCRQLHEIDVKLERFLSCSLFKKNLEVNRKDVLIIVIPVLVLMAMLSCMFYFLIRLFIERTQDEVRQGMVQYFMKMPYGTCITIMVLIIFILILLCATMLYGLINEFCLDERYTISVLNNRKTRKSTKKKFIQ